MRSAKIVFLSAALGACGGQTVTPPETQDKDLWIHGEQGESVQRIDVSIAAKSDSSITGNAVLEELDGDAVKVTVQLGGASPGLHGVHIHEAADCTAPDATSAGPHFNPTGHHHALPPGQRHLGDLGNLLVLEDGTGRLEITVKGASLAKEAPDSFLNRAIVVHAEEDTGQGDSGEAGARIGCGEITIDAADHVAMR